LLYQNLLKILNAVAVSGLKQKELHISILHGRTDTLVFLLAVPKKDTVVRYIANQKEHHKTLSYKEEVLKFLQEYNIDYDERYLWD